MKRLALLFNARYSPAAWNIIIPLLAVVIALLIVVLIYLYLEKIKALFAKKEDSESTKVVEVVKVATTTEKVFVAAPVTKVGQSASIGDGRIIYNYSFQARRHLMDEKGLALYNTLKNHIMAYDHVSVNQTWDHEIFTSSGRALVKLRFHGKTFKVYLDVAARDYPEPKYALSDESKKKAHATTPTLLNVRGPRMMQYALSLISDIAQARGLTLNEAYEDADFKVDAKTRKQLFDEGLIKSSDGTFTLVD